MTIERTFSMSVADLRTNWQKFDNYLSFERESVWPLNKERLFIEGLLRGYPSTEFLVVRVGENFAFIDGKQRFLALRRFLEDAFTTFKSKQNPPYGSLDPNKQHSQLTMHLQSVLEQTQFRFVVVAEMEEWMLADLYRWLQYHQPLMLSEKVWTYPSETKRQAIKLLNHEFWRDIYGGNQGRMRPFLGCYYLMLIEASSSEVNITERRLREFAAGSDDQIVDEKMIEKISGRLDTATHVFKGTVLKNVKEMIPVYEAVDVLENSDVHAKQAEAGCLTHWYKQVQENAFSEKQKYGIVDDLFRLSYVKYRQSFRDKQSDAIIAAAKAKAIQVAENIRWPVDIDKLVDRQGGLCLLCDRLVENVLSGDYVLEYQKDTDISLDNCSLVHKLCHEKLSQSMPHLGLEAIDLTGTIEDNE